jgi:hypothetical protein
MATSVAATNADGALSAAKQAVSQAGLNAIATDAIIFGDMIEGTTLDESARWTKSTANGGTVTQTVADGILINPSTATNGSAQILSNPVVPYMSFAETSARFTVVMGTAGVASNTRDLLLIVDANNYAGFVLDGSTWVARAYTAGAVFAPDVPINMVRADDLIPMDLEIRIQRMPDRVSMIWHGPGGPVSLATFAQYQSATRLFQGGLAQFRARSVNAGSTAANTMKLYSVGVTRKGAPIHLLVQTATGTADTLVCRGPCWVLSAMKITNAAGVVNITNAVAAGGTAIVSLGAAANPGDNVLPYPILCYNGLFVDVTSGTDTWVVQYVPI